MQLLKANWDSSRGAILERIPLYVADSIQEMLKDRPIGDSNIDEVPPQGLAQTPGMIELGQEGGAGDDGLYGLLDSPKSDDVKPQKNNTAKTAKPKKNVGNLLESDDDEEVMVVQKQ